LVTATAFLSGEFLAVRAGNAYAGLGSGLCHRKPKILPTLKGQLLGVSPNPNLKNF
jgi:hypothetical protein